jgi:hypothetical protein
MNSKRVVFQLFINSDVYGVGTEMFVTISEQKIL